MPSPIASTPTFEQLGSYVLGIGTATPRISWKVTSAPQDWVQTDAEIEITRPSGRTNFTTHSSAQLGIPWPDAELASGERASVRVRVAGHTSHSSDDEPQWGPWSEAASVEAGLLNAADWQARFIAPAAQGADYVFGPAPTLAQTFTLTGDAGPARLYISAHGTYQVFINGQAIEQDLLAPGWTSYHHRLLYQTYDVAPYLTSGENTISVIVGSGWYHGKAGYEKRYAIYGDGPALLAQLHVAGQVIATDDTWLAGTSNVLEHSFFDGQTTDLRTTPPPPSEPTKVVSTDLSTVTAPVAPGVRQVAELEPAEFTELGPGHYRVDFGQNFVGWIRLALPHAAGEEVTLRHAEVLENGELGTRPLRTAKATDTFLLPTTDEPLTLEPAFTFHGFRYAEIHGLPELTPAQVRGIAISSAQRRTGYFESSDARLNQLHSNVAWSMIGNFVSIPTDCPQRDERLGWTGDLQVFAPTATYLFDVNGLLDNWLADLAADQHADGAVPWVVPDILLAQSPPTAAWGDAAVIVPWELYQTTGDARRLIEQLPSMAAFVDAVIARAGQPTDPQGRLWVGDFQFGDWLDPAAPPENAFAAKTDRDLVATACFYRCADTLAQAYEVAGDDARAAHYAQVATEVKDAFNRAYITPSGKMVSDAATAYAIAICWGLADDPAALGQRLADVVRGEDYRVTTGFVGTPVLTHALSLTGQTESAYRLLLQDQCPSWLYPVSMGATTIWERWDSMLPDGSINLGQMTSFNHYALGAVADWLHRNVAGLRRVAPAYSRVVIAPEVTHQLEYARTSIDSPYGVIAAGWQRTEAGIEVHATIPVGVRAYVELPDGASFEVTHGQHTWLSGDVPTPTPPQTIGDVIDNAQLWNSIVAQVQALGYLTDGRQGAERVSRALHEPLSQLALRLCPPFKAQFEPEIAEQINPLLEPAPLEAAQ